MLLMMMESSALILCIVLFYGIRLSCSASAGSKSQNSGVVSIARCRAQCLSKVGHCNFQVWILTYAHNLWNLFEPSRENP